MEDRRLRGKGGGRTVEDRRKRGEGGRERGRVEGEKGGKGGEGGSEGTHTAKTGC